MSKNAKIAAGGVAVGIILLFWLPWWAALLIVLGVPAAAYLTLDPSQRRRGIGSALLEEMIERAGPDEEYTLEVRPSNAHAITLYERLGFRAAGRRPRYYRDNGEDALIMWRTLQTTSESTASG